MIEFKVYGNDAINESRTDKNAVLIDVRAKDVYKRDISVAVSIFQ